MAGQFAYYPPSDSGGGVTDVTASAPLSSSGGTTPNISLTGTFPVPIQTVTANYIMLSTDQYILVDAVGYTDITLLSSPPDGTLAIVKNINIGTVTIIGTIDDSTNASLTHQYESLSLIAKDGVWYIW